MKFPTQFLAGLFLLMCVLPLQAQNLSYKFNAVWLEGTEASTSLMINQTGSKAVAISTTNGNPVQASDPSAGIKAAKIENKMALMVDAMGQSSGYKPGDILVEGFAENSTATVTSFTYSLEKGKEKQTLEGQKTEHYILSAKLEVSVVDDQGNKSTNVEAGTADLWVAKKLPFSWLPYTLANNNFRKSAIPFGFVRHNIATFLLTQFEADLKKMGLLLKARATTTVTQTGQYGEISNSYVREVTVSELETNSNTSVEIPDLEYVSEAQFTTMYSWLFISRSYCSAEAGNIEASVSDQSIEGKGTIQFKETDEKTGTTWLSAGMLDYRNMEAESSCLIVGVKPAKIVAGEYAVMDQEAFVSTLNGSLICLIKIVNGAPTLTFVEDGEVQIFGTGPSMQATLNGEALSITLSEQKTTLQQNVNVQMDLEIQMESGN